jgi:hypothetical protein
MQLEVLVSLVGVQMSSLVCRQIYECLMGTNVVVLVALGDGDGGGSTPVQCLGELLAIWLMSGMAQVRRVHISQYVQLVSEFFRSVRHVICFPSRPPRE